MDAVATPSAGRPLAVTAAIVLLLAEFVLSLFNLLVAFPQADPMGPPISYKAWAGPVFVGLYGVGIFLIYRIAQGSPWARWIYLGIFVFTIAWATSTCLELGTAFDDLATHYALPPPSDADPYDSRSYPRLFGLVREEWRIVEHGVVLAQALMLAVAFWLLFRPPASRWFKSTKKQAVN